MKILYIILSIIIAFFALLFGVVALKSIVEIILVILRLILMDGTNYDYGFELGKLAAAVGVGVVTFFIARFLYKLMKYVWSYRNL
ncbi:MAG: hypothetical protein H6586_02290 [Flavobacteriales bacterium]|nr:hypothetical protein [Flavobacteriales bacterium]